MLTVEALKNLYVAMGGDAAAVANIDLNPEAVSAIAALVESGGGTGGADIVLKLNHDNFADATAAEMLKGDYAALREKCLAGENVMAIAYGYRTVLDDYYFASSAITAVNFTTYVPSGQPDKLLVYVYTLGQQTTIKTFQINPDNSVSVIS